MSDTYEEYPSLYPTISEESIKENSEVESETINLEEKSVESDCDQIVPDLTKRNLVEIEDETDEKESSQTFHVGFSSESTQLRQSFYRESFP